MITNYSGWKPINKRINKLPLNVMDTKDKKLPPKSSNHIYTHPFILRKYKEQKTVMVKSQQNNQDPHTQNRYILP